MDLFRKYHGEELLKNMLELRDDYAICEAKDSIERRELISYYRKFIKMCSEITNEMAIPNNSISSILLLDVLMKIGYFSHGKKIMHVKGIEDILKSKPGISVVTGKVVCRHKANFITDVFKLLPGFCENFYCLRSDISKKETLSGHGNHMANVLEYNGVYYVYDATYHIFYEFRNPIELISKEKKEFLYYKPEVQLAMEKVSLEDLETRLREYKKSSNSKKISLKELNEIQSETASNIVAKSKILNEFELNTYAIKKKIYTLSKSR